MWLLSVVACTSMRCARGTRDAYPHSSRARLQSRLNGETNHSGLREPPDSNLLD